MLCRMYQDRWHSVDLASVDSRANGKELPDPGYFQKFYQRLEDRNDNLAQGWIVDKVRLGEVIERSVLAPATRALGRKPRVLSAGAGMGIVERAWLDRGYDVTFQECQLASLRSTLSKYPSAQAIIGDLRSVDLAGSYDVITLFAVEYVFDNRDLAVVFDRLVLSLAPGGVLVVLSVSVLSLVQLAKEAAKRMLRMRNRLHRGILWGYWRTPGEIGSLLMRANLTVDRCYRMDSSAALCSRSFPRVPTFSSKSLVFTARHAG